MIGLRPPRRLVAAAIALAVLVVEHPVVAQPPGGQTGLREEFAPQIRGVLADSDRVLDRLKMTLDLTTPAERKQYDTLAEFIEVFLIGVDRTRPVRMDVLTAGVETTYRLDIPIDPGKDGFTDFWKLNLVPLGIPVRRYPDKPDLYKLGGKANDAFTGYMQFDAKKRDRYATIVEDAKALHPANVADPTKAVADLLEAKYDAALRLENQPEGVEERHAHYAGDREEVLSKLKRDTDESVSDFNLRKFYAGIQFDESERFYAEAKNLVIGLKVIPDASKESGNLSVRLEPLPGTPLAESIALVGKEPSRFAGVPRGEGAATSGRIHLPLDEFRKKNYLALTDKIRDDELQEIDADKSTAEQKEAGKDLVNRFFDLVKTGIGTGLFDGFVEMAKGDDGVYSLVGGLKVARGEDWLPLIEVLPKTLNGPQVKLNVGEHAGVAFHELMLNKTQHPDFIELFGDGRLLAGIGPDAVWYAAGPNAEETLKKTIDEAAEKRDADTQMVSFRGELLPFVRIADRRLGERGQVDLREMAIQAFSNGEGRLTLDLSREGDGVEGSMTLDRGIIRLIGKGLADFSKENLAE